MNYFTRQWPWIISAIFLFPLSGLAQYAAHPTFAEAAHNIEPAALSLSTYQLTGAISAEKAIRTKLTLSNNGVQSLVWQASSQADWLHISHKAGVTAAGDSLELICLLNPRSLPAGEYHTLLQIETNDPINPIVEVPVTLYYRKEIPSEPTVALYPNPVQRQLIITPHHIPVQQAHLIVSDLSGKQLVSQTIQTSSSTSIDLKNLNLPSGQYMIRLDWESGNWSAPLSLQ